MQTLRVLHFLLQNPSETNCGASLIKNLCTSSGTIYPILLRLEKDGFVKSAWETEDPSVLGRPRRRLYKITGTGAKVTQDALSEFNTTLLQPKLAHEGVM